ncbi:MAG TPA: DNA damage-inducible protein D [Ktedonobacter sp.]|nr:DNA damage-inducible protein D [Ktedonobacter sp.]
MEDFTISPFDAIRQVDEKGKEYWNARDLAKILGYRQYTNFTRAISKAEIACKESGEAVSDHFLHKQEMIHGGKGAKRPYPTVHLSRFACYLLVENADPEGRPIVALGQKYFAIQTRRQELADELTLSGLPEDQKRLIYRQEMAVLNHQLAAVARLSGVVKPEHFATFTDRGYQGLYHGETENQIHARKELQEDEHILDFMGSDELIANAFRASLTRQRLDRDKTKDREQANQIHFRVGRAVRQTIIEQGGTVPEELPTPQKSIQQLQQEEQKRLEQRKQPLLFDFPSE